MKIIKKTALSLLAASLILLSSCEGENNKNTPTETANPSATAIQTDAEGGWFVSFGEYRYYTNGKEASIVTYEGKDTKLTLPAKYKEIPVVSVAWSAFAKNEKLEEVTVPEPIRVLGVSAFAECTSLKKITLSDSVTKIDINCFTGCTSLKEIHLTKSVEDIGISAFSKCTSLSAVTCAGENGTFKADGGVLYSKDGSKLILYPAGKKDETYKVDPATSAISDRACEGNAYIKTVDLQNVTDIGSYAFKDCTNLLNVYHNKTMTVAGGAFENTFYESLSNSTTGTESPTSSEIRD